MASNRRSRTPSLQLTFNEADGVVSTTLAVEGSLQLNFLDESPLQIRVVGYPKKLQAEAALHDFLLRETGNRNVEARLLLEKIVSLTEDQISKKMTDLRTEIRKLALLSARAKVAKRLRKKLTSGELS